MDAATVVVIVNHNTPGLLSICYDTLRKYYPSVPVHIIDNGSNQPSVSLIKRICKWSEHTVATYNKVNVGHGPAMHQAMIMPRPESYVLFLDSDCRVDKGGFIEEMRGCFSDPGVYCVGRIIRVNSVGIHTGHPDDTRYVDLSTAMFSRQIYSILAPFNHHGAPAMLNYRSATSKGFKLVNFRVRKYVYHKGMGTVRKVGIPDWDANVTESRPKDAKSAEEMLRRLR